jgi:hypothetical protein
MVSDSVFLPPFKRVYNFGCIYDTDVKIVLRETKY